MHRLVSPTVNQSLSQPLAAQQPASATAISARTDFIVSHKTPTSVWHGI